MLIHNNDLFLDVLYLGFSVIVHLHFGSNNPVLFLFLRLDVDEDLKVMKVLSPQPKPLPKTILILTEIQFMDSS